MYIQKKISKSLTTFSGVHFPCSLSSKRKLRYEVTLGIGGNIGDVKRRFEHLFFFFKREKKVKLKKTGLILKNPPFGYEKQEDFFNSIIVLETSMVPFEFLRYILKVEKKFGRKRSFANAPRTLDLDIIFFDNKIITTKDLVVPHPYYKERESVMIPLRGIK